MRRPDGPGAGVIPPGRVALCRIDEGPLDRDGQTGGLFLVSISNLVDKWAGRNAW